MFAFHSIRHLSVVTLATLGLAGMTAAIGLVATVPALAAEKTADVGKYCRKVHGRDAIANIDRRDDGLMCTRPIRRGPGMLHRKIKAADVCADQHRTQRFRRQGLRLTCITGSGGGTQTAKTIDLANYCRTRYGPKAFVTRRRTDDRPMCTIRTDRGLGLRHHLIDLAGLCGGGSPRALGNTLKCSPGTTAGGDGPGTTPGGGSETRPTKSGPLPRPRRVDGSTITWSDLRGCGGLGPTAKRLTAQFADWNPPRGRGWNRGGTQLPCSRLAGGRSVDLAQYCRKRFFWKVGKESSDDPAYREVLYWVDGKWPACTKRVFSADPKQYWRALKTADLHLSDACYWGSGQRFMLPHYNAAYVAAFRYVNRRLECFYFTWDQYRTVLSARGTKPSTVGKASYRIEFVAADPPRKVLTKLRPGLRFIVRLVYKRDPGGRSKPVTLRQLKGGASIRLTARRVKRTNVFETGVVRLRIKGTP